MYRQELLHEIVKKYKQDPSSVYNIWFIGSEERLKAFRAIRRGVLQVIEEPKNSVMILKVHPLKLY